jgi:hypothetical protein
VKWEDRKERNKIIPTSIVATFNKQGFCLYALRYNILYLVYQSKMVFLGSIGLLSFVNGFVLIMFFCCISFNNLTAVQTNHIIYCRLCLARYEGIKYHYQSHSEVVIQSQSFQLFIIIIKLVLQGFTFKQINRYFIGIIHSFLNPFNPFKPLIVL